MNIEIVSEELMLDIKTIEKNGCKLRALRIPVAAGIEALMYEETVNKCVDISAVIAEIEQAKSSYKINREEICNNFADPDWLFDNVRLFVQKNKPAEGIKYLDFEDLYVVYYIPVDENGSCLLTYELARIITKKHRGIYVQALKNSRHYKAQHVLDFMCEKFGLPAPPEAMKAEAPMYYLGNEKGYRGSSVLADYFALDKVCDDYDVKYLTIFPSSVHEVLFIPSATYPSAEDLAQFAEMINDINSKEVAPDEILSDHPYVYTKSEGLTW